MGEDSNTDHGSRLCNINGVPNLPIVDACWHRESWGWKLYESGRNIVSIASAWGATVGSNGVVPPVRRWSQKGHQR